MDDYDNNWDYGGDMPGSSGSDLQYGSDIEPSPTYGGDVGAYGNVDYPADWGSEYDFSQFDPEQALMDQGGYTPPSEDGWAGKLSDAFMRHLKNNPGQVLGQLAGLGGSLYSTMQSKKQREAQARQIQDARAARQARLDKYGAVLPMKLERSMLPQGNLLTAGMRPGGINWFTPAKYTNMAEGGAVEDSWLDRLGRAFAARRAAPAVTGAGMASRTGETVQNRAYENYRQMQEMNDAKPLPYEIWLQMQQQGKGMAEGGWLTKVMDALSSRRAAPEVVGAGTASRAGQDIQDRAYQNYAQMQEMNDAKPLPYEIWLQMRQQGAGRAKGGLSSMITGPGDGTSDDVPINASAGEYILDADAVSALGNGDNAAGAKKLDEMRQRLRAHKRSAPVDKIPPAAKKPEAYMKGK